MSSTWKIAIVAVVCLVVAGFCICRLGPRRARITPEMGFQSRVCDACGHRFEGTPDPVVVECPRCHKKAGVRTYVYTCEACGERFEAFRERPADPDAPYDPDKPPVLVYKRPGGDWVKTFGELGEIVCPKCNSPKVRPPWPD